MYLPFQGTGSFEEAYRTDLDPSTGGYIDVTTEVKQKISARKKNSTKFLIGMASGASGCLQKRWEEVCESKKMRWITEVYKTSSSNFRDTLFQKLKEHYEKKKSVGFEYDPDIPQSVSDKECTWIIYLAWNDKVSIIDYELRCTIVANIFPQSTASEVTKFDKAYELLDESIIAGGYNKALQDAISFVELRVKASHSFWIGATSHGEVGCKNRWDVTYKKRGMTHMAPVYKTNSEYFRVKMEKELIDYFLCQFPSNCQNFKAGGGGPTGDPPYIIYVVWKQ